MRELPFSRIKALPGPLPGGGLTAEDYQRDYRIAYAAPADTLDAEGKRREGKVVLDAVIGKDGVILTLSAREGDPLLHEPALEAVRHWTYRPLKVNGVPVEVATQIEVHFGA